MAKYLVIPGPESAEELMALYGITESDCIIYKESAPVPSVVGLILLTSRPQGGYDTYLSNLRKRGCE